MKLLIQPGDGIAPLIKGINRAKERVEIMIFRFDRGDIERALANAVSRGLFVHALIAYTNRGGERNLRRLEMRLLAAGVTVARTANDLARYHGKMMLVDRRELYLLAFNYTFLDIEHSRSFGVITRNSGIVREAGRLFESDVKRQAYTPGAGRLVVSPVNARKQLASFLKGARKELLIYDPEVSDPAMVRILEDRAAAGVDVRIIGRVGRTGKLVARKLGSMRLHTRSIIRDREHAFIGSQSLRELELDKRRELGLILRDRKVVHRMMKTFAEDWRLSEAYDELPLAESRTPVERLAKKVAKAVANELPPLTPVLEVVVKEVIGNPDAIDLNPRKVEETVKEAVRGAVKEAVKDVVEQVGTGRPN